MKNTNNKLQIYCIFEKDEIELQNLIKEIFLEFIEEKKK